LKAKASGNSEVIWKDSSLLYAGSHGKYFYPSVDCGMIDISKAKQEIEWKPTSLEQAVRETYEFFQDADFYDKEFKIAEKKFEKVKKYYPE